MPLFASLFGAFVLAQTVPPAKAATATTSTQDMYKFWCTEARASSIICQHRQLLGKMTAATDADERKKISDEIRALVKPTSMPPPGQPRPLSPFTKEYQSMKMAFCATNPAGAKTLCSTAASQYKTPSSSATNKATASPTSTSPSPSVLSYNEVWEWYCSKVGKPDGEKQVACDNFQKRSQLSNELRTAGLVSSKRAQLTSQLRQIPAPAFATNQAVYADYCKLPANSAKTACTRLKQTQASLVMRKWYCSQGGNAAGPWCRRSDVLDKLQKIPANTIDPTLSEQRKALSSQYAAFSKPPVSGGPSLSAQIAKEIVEAKKQYCEISTNKVIPYCKPPPMNIG